MEAKLGQSKISFLMVRLEKKFSRTCSSCESSDLGNAARDAIALWRELILSSKVGCNMPPEPPVATCVCHGFYQKRQCLVTQIGRVKLNIKVIFITSYMTSLPKFDRISSPTFSMHTSRRPCIGNYDQTLFSVQLPNSEVIDLISCNYQNQYN
jgi:hypothetical protein